MAVIIGAGNLILGDDGFGIHVIERLKKMKEFENVKIVDSMTNSAIMLEAMDGEDRAIIVDAIDVGQEEGIAVYRFNPKEEDFPSDIMLSMHDLHFRDVIAMARGVYNLPDEIVIVGVKPERVELSMDLSESCSRYIDEVIEFIRKELGISPMS
ncbi:hydrogenase maturation protease [Geoglobus acetivorans]|uniref:Hydrogenase maturation protease n=1 Tax=Geoglobus acetivorans TaxID=565033 RepID=A0A0A7GD63_GEOAI|nr:Hydrogenase maturation protease [Geoglobus acetivorans]